MRSVRHFLVLLVIVAAAGGVSAQDDSTLFPRPASLEPAIRFWTRVYTEIDTSSGFLHDSENLGAVYETLRFPPGTTPRERRRRTTRAADEYEGILAKLGGGARSDLSTEEARVLAMWPAGTKDAEFRAAAHRIRFQLGQADRFKAGLLRSGRYKPYIEATLASKGVPRELAVLPHVESSFDPTAYSKVGAAGMWQFTRSTGLRYMQIDHIIDARRDPFLSTDAAAQLLQDNFSVIGSWPLAITAYNHGLAGMRRAVALEKTHDIGTIVENYKSRTFGFASRNFYAAFLAALDVDANAERYFGPLDIEAPEDLVVVDVPDYVESDTVERVLGLRRAELQRLNPALMDSVWAGDKYVPKGFPLRVPQRADADVAALLAGIPATERYAAQQPDLYHRVRRGETLSQIAQSYHLSVAALVRANGLSSRNFIRAGQTLTLPVAAGAPQPTLAAVGGADAQGSYVVRAGDSIDRIARRLSIDQDALLAVNNIRNKNRIYAGQVLTIPGEGPDREPAGGTLAAAAEGLLSAGLAAVIDTADASEGVEPAIEPAIEPALDPDVPAAAPETGPDTDDNAEADLESNVLASTQARLAADPSDYTVADDDTIEVQALETLGHYADWLEIRTQALRDLNAMPFGRAVVYGQRIRLDFSRVDRKTFEERRLAYQEQRQESFFSSHQIAAIKEHVIRSGESLWILAHRTYKVPVWLLRQYNPDLDLDRIAPGMVVKFPLLQPIADDNGSVPSDGELG